MFDESRGFFYLVFANDDDCFFTESYIRLDFYSYLKMHLIDDEFRQICFISKNAVNCEYAYKMDFIGKLSKELTGYLKKKKPAPRGWMKKMSRQPSDNVEYVSSETGKKVRCEFDFQLMKECLLKVIELMETSRDTAIVCPIEVFAECCEVEAVLKKLISRQNRSNHNVMILTGSADGAENDRYFRNPKYVYQGKGDPPVSDIFFNDKLFPEVAGKFSEISANIPKLVLTYEALKEAFAERMVVLNSLSYERLRIAVRYVLMRRNNDNLRFSSDAYAALLWAWYENDDFREKYPQAAFPDNPFRSMKVITDYITENGFSHEAEAAIEAEKAWNNQDFVNRWFCGDKGVAVAYDERTLKNSGCSAILDEMDEFRRVIEGHETVIGSEGMRLLVQMKRHFSKPSYTSVHNMVELPHERFNEKENKKIIRKLYESLRQKLEWNNWDDGAMLLLYTLFELCWRHSTTVSSIDYFNQLGELQFTKCLQAISFCLRNSVDSPYDNSRASKFITEAVNVLRSGDLKKTKTYIVLKGEKKAYG